MTNNKDENQTTNREDSILTSSAENLLAMRLDFALRVLTLLPGDTRINNRYLTSGMPSISPLEESQASDPDESQEVDDQETPSFRP